MRSALRRWLGHQSEEIKTWAEAFKRQCDEQLEENDFAGAMGGFAGGGWGECCANGYHADFARGGRAGA